MGTITFTLCAGKRSRYSDWLRGGRSGYQIPVGAWFSAPVQTGPGAHPASCTMGTGSFEGVKSGRGVTLSPHPLLVPRSRKRRAIPLLPLWAVRPVQSLSACTRVHFTFTFSYNHSTTPTTEQTSVLCHYTISTSVILLFIFRPKCRVSSEVITRCCWWSEFSGMLHGVEW